MAVLDVQKFLKEIKHSKHLFPVYLFVGEEESLIAESLTAFRAVFAQRCGNENPEFNSEILHGEKESSERILESCLTLPFGSDKKLVVVHHLEKLSNQSLNALKEYCRWPNPSTCLALLWNAKLNQATLNGELTNQISAKGLVVRCWKLREERRVEWIREKLNQLKRNISMEAAELLSKEGGESIRELQSEMDKLLLFVGERKTIELADVRETMSFRRNRSVWDFLENFEKGRIKRAGQILQRCLEQGEEPLKILNLMARSYRTRMRAEKSLNADPHGNLRAAALFNELKKSDLLLKSGEGKESGIFERLLNLCGGSYRT